VRAPGRLSSSRPTTSNSSRGFDTVSLHWPRQSGSELLSAIVQAPTSPTVGGGLLVAESLPGGLRVAAWPEYGTVKVEGRLAALIDRDRRSYRLCSRDELREADSSARTQLLEVLGHAPVGDVVGVGRYDLTFEHRFAAGDEGRDFLHALAALMPPAGYDRRVYSREGQVTSVAYLTRRAHRVVFRAYDKGVELAGRGIEGAEPPGTRIRLEAQNRAKSADRQRPAVLAERDLRHDFGRTLAPVLDSGHDVSVRGTEAVVDELLSRAHRGELGMRTAARLIGDVEILRRYGRAGYADERLARDRIRALREAGVPLSEELPPERIVPVGELLRQAVEEFAA
jgi:hypothetical protein